MTTTTTDEEQKPQRAAPSPYGLIPVREAAQLLGISRQRVCYYIRRGDLPAVSFNGKDYLLTRDDIRRFNAKRIPVGRPDRAKLKKLAPHRQEAAQRRAAMAEQPNVDPV